MLPHRLACLSACAVLGMTLSSVAAPEADKEKKIVLIGGPASHGPGEHDFNHGITLLETLLEQSDDLKRIEEASVSAFPYDWPEQPGALENAATIVFYFDGGRRHPLLDERRRAHVERLMSEGVGLVALHQAFTVPEDSPVIDFPAWLGGVRIGLHDRTLDVARLEVESRDHPVSRGVGDMIIYDEFYPTLEFVEGDGKATPILAGALRPQFVAGEPVLADSQRAVVAWALERGNGGRSFAFSGGHFLEVLDEPALRTLVLNAILWTAGIDVPEGGAGTQADASAARKLAFPGRFAGAVPESVVTRKDEIQIVDTSWGRIEWHVSGPLGNSDSMTTGIARLLVGASNPRHFHPNCDEVLHVLKGRIRHTMNDKTVDMGPGDTVFIRENVHHNATNIGDEEAVLAISFSSAWREVVGE